MEVEERFAALVERLRSEPGVEAPDPGGRGFGSGTLKVNGSIFAMVSAGRLVLKLPGPRVADLIQEGTGAPFDSGKGRPMKQWVTIVTEDDETCSALTREALDFVGSRPKRP